MPFTEETLDFMALNRVMNSREWFHEHKDEYKRLIVSPMAELLDAIAPGMLEIDPSLIIVPRPGKASRASGATRAAARSCRSTATCSGST